MSEQTLFVGIDLGGTNTRLILVDSHLKILDTASLSTDLTTEPELAVSSWGDIINGWKSNGKILGVGIGAPGPLDSKDGFIIETPNLQSWAGFKINAILNKKVNLPICLENDANCAALGEWSKTNVPHMVLLTLGTGVGSGVISDGKLITGALGFAVEAGHMTILKDGRACHCGKNGCLEAYVGAKHFVAEYNRQNNGKPPLIGAKEVFDLYRLKSVLAIEVVNEWLECLAIGIGNLANLFNPQEIVLAGGMSPNILLFEKELISKVRQQAFKKMTQKLKIHVSDLQDHAGVVGAAYLAKLNFGTKA